MAVTVVRSGFNGTTAGAPSLSGTVGSLIAVLDFCLVTTLGWAKEFSGTNLAAYRAPSGNRMRLYVDDTNAQNARLRGYEVMTSISEGTGLFPTDAQVSGGLYHYKSTAASSADRPYVFVSDGKLFHFFSTVAGATTDWCGWSFGDFESYKSADAYNTVLISAHVASQNGMGLYYMGVNLTTASQGHYVARSYTQVGNSIAVLKFTDAVRANGQNMGNGGAAYPAPIEGGILLGPCWLGEVNVGARGRLPGVWAPLHPRTGSPIQHADTFAGAGVLAGRTFEAITIAGNAGQAVIETSDTWGTY